MYLLLSQSTVHELPFLSILSNVHHVRDTGIKLSLNVVSHALLQLALEARNSFPTYFQTLSKPIPSCYNAQLPCHSLKALSSP